MSGCHHFSFKGSISRLRLLESKLIDLRSHYKKEEVVKFRAEKIDYVNQCLDNVKVNLTDANMCDSLCKLVKDMEIKLDMYSSQIKNLSNENTWLHEELKEVQERLKNAEMQLIEETEKLKHLEFLNSEGSVVVFNDSRMLEQNYMCSTSIECEPEVKKRGAKRVSSETFTKLEQNDLGGQITEIPTYNFGTLKTLDDIVSKYFAEKRYELSIPLCKEAIEEIKGINPEHPDIASIYILLSSAYREQGNFMEAKDSLYECLKLRESIFGEEHPIIASTYNNLSVLYGKSKKFMQAEILCRRALAIRQKVFGEDHLDVAKQLVNLAVLNQNQSKWPEAEACYIKALKIYESSLPSDDPNISKVKSQLSLVLIKASKFIEAETMIKDMIEEAITSMSAVTYHEGHEVSLDNILSDSSKSMSEYGDWHKSVCAAPPTLMQHIKNLVLLYKRSGNKEKTYEIDQIAKDFQKIKSINELKSMVLKLGVNIKE